MTHLSEDCNPLHIRHYSVAEDDVSGRRLPELTDVCLLILPASTRTEYHSEIFTQFILTIVQKLGPEATLITIGEPADLVHFHTCIAASMQYQLWISIKSDRPSPDENLSALPRYHFGALVHTKYTGTLKHAKTRIQYTYCPACDKTTKDYGGKKHTYHPYGTLISDVWRDISADLSGDLDHVIKRFADIFGIQPYQELLVMDCRALPRDFPQADQTEIAEKEKEYALQTSLFTTSDKEKEASSQLILGDTLEKLRLVPENSIDFAFADPPYNLKKKYNDYTDDLSITAYFEWCDAWIGELARVLKPGRTCAVLNIPLWAIRHFLYMEKILTFQNWIVWDALSFPVRRIMPAHYAILCFSKGPARPLPGLTGRSGDFQLVPGSSVTFDPLSPLAEWYCLRSSCAKKRYREQMNDRGSLTDLWWDVHRLKHNTRRVDHPCQLPSPLMYRLISLFTEPGEMVLDCFNGAGTTTLAAHQMNREYIGIELSEKYHGITESRHEEIRNGLDPFRKVKRKLTEKNSPVERMPEQVYKVPKRTLQLEVRRVAEKLGRLPSREEMIQHGSYPIRYYDEYFVSWGEVCAAARHGGMSETRPSDAESSKRQLNLFDH